MDFSSMKKNIVDKINEVSLFCLFGTPILQTCNNGITAFTTVVLYLFSTKLSRRMDSLFEK